MRRKPHVSGQALHPRGTHVCRCLPGSRRASCLGADDAQLALGVGWLLRGALAESVGASEGPLATLPAAVPAASTTVYPADEKADQP